MTVRKRAIHPRSISAHLVCVPGWQTSPSPISPVASAPNSCTSLAAHDVGARGFVIGDAGHDADIGSGPVHRRRNARKPGRRGHVWNLDPAAVRADHARHQQRQPVMARAQVGDARGEIVDLEDAVVVVEGGRRGVAGDHPAAPVGGTPIDAEKAPQQCDSRVTTDPLEPRRKSRSAPSSACSTVSTYSLYQPRV